MDIRVNNISKSYGEKQVLSHFSACFPQGEVSAVMAPSGRGKTTLLRLILGLEKPDAGEITGVPEAKSALFQEDRLCPELSVLGNIRMVTGRTVPEEEIRRLLAFLGLEESVETPARALSGGMARRTALARALLYPGELLVLDEPFNGLDSGARERAAQAIVRYAPERTVLLVTHRREELELLNASRLVEIR